MSRSLEAMLTELGLSGLEAEVYITVLEESGSTGYRISQVLGKAAPNTYKALNSLVVKGAILLDEGEGSKTYTAVSVDELAEQQRRNIASLAEEIGKSLESRYKRTKQSGLYSLTSVSQVFARAEVMIREAKVSIVMDADVNPVKEMSGILESAAARGVKVLIHGREPLSIPGCEYISSVTEGWAGDMMVLIADSAEYLICFMTSGMSVVTKAVWSSNFVAPCLHRSYLGKAMFYRMAMLLSKPDITIDELRTQMKDVWEKAGYSDLDQGALTWLLS